MNSTQTTPLGPKDWLIGALGVWMGSPDDGWRRLGPYTYVTNDITIDTDSGNDCVPILIAAANGLWQASSDPTKRWIQLHDETLTEVTAVRKTAAGVIAAGTYGVARANRDDLGILRWRSNTENHVPDERYTNNLHVGSDGPWLAATEAGILLSDDAGRHWHLSDLRDTPVRALRRIEDGWLAGSDSRGLWHSADGASWDAVESPTASVFAIASAGDQLLLGGYDGIYIRDADLSWRRCGPRALIGSLAAREGMWLAGADPGGLWSSQDNGVSWHRTGEFGRVRVIREPMHLTTEGT